MTFGQSVADQYVFSTTEYHENMDPSFYHTFYSEEIPSSPVRTVCSKYAKFERHSYINALSYIKRSTDTFHDFPVTVNVFYLIKLGENIFIL